MKKDMENILARHRARYPKMALQDAVKLFYQQCFGPVSYTHLDVYKRQL